MPEIKQQFMGGKMNKDSDERLVPNGQYRDAMNIQVATSEGSEVGTAQNVLGNELITVYIPSATGVYDSTSPIFTIPSDAEVIGAISDEKIDTMYYLIWTQTTDYILSWRKGDTSPEFVFVDIQKNILKFPGDKIITGINVIDGLLFWTDNINEPRKINVQRCKEGTISTGNTLTQTQLRNNMSGLMVPIEEKHITVIKEGPQVALDMSMHTHRDANKLYTAVIEISPTDDGTSSFSSSNPPGTYNFSALTTETGSNEFTVEILTGIGGLQNAETPLQAINIASGIPNITGGPLEMLDGMGDIYSTTASGFVGKKVVLQAYRTDIYGVATPPGLPLTNYVIRGVITGVGNNTPIASNNDGTNYFNRLRIEATTIDGFPEVADGIDNLKYVIDLFDETEKLFEFKYPRFSYRYKYEDGEYSTFAPFTQVAFVPGSFDYHPRKGYNIGMVNRLSKIELFNAVTEETPDDVVAVEILFKDDASPSIYTVDTIKPDDFSLLGTKNLWNLMLASSVDASIPPTPFTIEREAVNSIVPSNQLLRPWDNVPKKALAQDVTGNRIVYANYVQNYDLISKNGNKYVPNFTVGVNNAFATGTANSVPLYWNATSITSSTYKSIKSLREYQLGVVFLDEFGRETPVLSNASGTVRIDKELASKANRFQVQFNSDDYPQALTHFKFFVKETSSEYYNMAMDRWYSAGDGNIWLAFPSSDRNKIDIDTFLILKKGSDQDVLVTEAARYKVLAIENEAPDYIKTSKRKAVVVRHNSTNNNDIFGTTTTDAPLEGLNEFKMNYQAFFGTAGRDLVNSEDELWIEFGLTGSDQVSDKYRIASIANDYDSSNLTAVPLSSTKYSVFLEKALGNDVNFITDSPSNPSKIQESTLVNIYKYKVENLNRFDGRFFVKIYSDEVFTRNIESTLIGGGTRVYASNKVYSMQSNMVDKHTTDAAFLTKPRFLTRGSGQPKSDNWIPFKADINKMDDQIPYGYYQVDEFAAHALYFRKYAVKPYQHDDGIGKSQTGGASPDTKLNNNDYQVLMHLKDGKDAGPSNTTPPTVVNYPNSHNGNVDFRPADNWNGEFGYHTSPKSTLIRAERLATSFTQYNDQYGVTANWRTTRTPGVAGLAAFSWFEENQDSYKSDEVSAQNNEVWFIDEAESAGLRGSYVDESFYPITNIDTPVDGIGLQDGPLHWNMELAFGGLLGAGYQGQSPTGFWNVGNWNTPSSEPTNTNYDGGIIEQFISRINGGYTFRWKEDPTETQYVAGNVISKSRMRHSYGKVAAVPFLPTYVNSAQPTYSNGFTTDESQANEPGKTRNEDLDSMAEKLSFNLTKNWEMNTIKATNALTTNLQWNPFEPGKVTTGLEIELKSVDPGTGTGTGANLSDDLKIFVNAVTAVDLTGKTIALHEGMALESVPAAAGTTKTIASVTAGLTHGNDFLVVRKITKLSSGAFELILAGYTNPLSQEMHTFITSSIVEKENFKFVQVGMNGYSSNSEFNINTIGRDYGIGAVGAVGYTLEFIDIIEPTEILSENPAIWETEPKDLTPLDIYYEACGSVPMSVNPGNIADAFPIGTRLPQFASGNGIFIVVGYNQDQILIENVYTAVVLGTPVAGKSMEFFRPDDLIIKTEILTVTAIAGTPTTRWSISVEGELTDNQFALPWHNCYSFGNGVESNRIRDNYNAPYISNGVKASTTLEQEYKEEHRKYGLIYSGIYNSVSGINNLNQFIQAEKITKDVNPKYGSIQKLYSRNSDLVALCEDKILKITANKDALFNADGNPQLIATNRVLGQTVPFSGEYGISTNPESFASDSYRGYFTDRVRGAVIRMSMDGLTPISNAGMQDFFRDNLKNYRKLVGSFDDRNDEYNIKLTNYNKIGQVNGFIPAAYLFVGSGQTLYTPLNDGIYIIDSAWNNIPNVNDIVVGSTISFVDPNTNDYLTPSYTSITSIEKGVQLTSTSGGSSSGANYVKIGISDSIVNQTTGLPPEYPLYLNPDSNQGIGAGFMNFGKSLNFMISISLNDPNKLLSFSEKVKGWVSFKSFVNMQMGISLANDYYTFDKGNLYLHYSENQSRNTFYSVFTPSSIDVILNDQPGLVKVYNTLNYEGSQSKVDKFTFIDSTDPNYVSIPFQPDTDYSDQEYYNLSDKQGWFVDSITTNEEEGYVNGFLDKEGKWFNYINKTVDTNTKADTSDFTFQGIGFSQGGGCTDPTADNFDPLATQDDNSCCCEVQVDFPFPTVCTTNGHPDCPGVLGCTDPTASNYDSDATIDNGRCCCEVQVDYPYPTNCNHPDCSDTGGSVCCNWCDDYGPGGPLEGQESNPPYDPSTGTQCQDWMCTDPAYCGTAVGCTDALAGNYDPLATTDDGSCCCTDDPALSQNPCVQGPGYSYCLGVLGCTDATAGNYDSTATIDNGTCIPCLYGCTSSNAANYNPSATCDNNTCVYNTPPPPPPPPPIAPTQAPTVSFTQEEELPPGESERGGY